MAGATFTTANAILKEVYLGAAREQLNNNDGVFAYATKNSQDIEGRRAVLAPHTKRNSGVGARAELGTLPNAGAQTWAEERVPLFYQYGRGQISGPIMRATKSDRGSFVRSLDAEMKGITLDLKRDVNRQAWGNADGTLSALGGTTNSIVVNLPSTYTSASTIWNQLEVGELLDIGTVASPTATSTGNAIVTVTPGSPGSITLTSAVTTSTTDYIFRSGAGGSGASQKEITGLQAIVASSGTLFNVNPSTSPSWVSTVNSNSGTNRSLTEALMARVVMDIGIACGTNDGLIGVGSPGVYRAFANLQTSLKRFTNTLDMQGGWKGLEFSSGTSPISITSDRDCPNNQLFFIQPKNYIEFKMSDWEFMEEDGNVLRAAGIGSSGIDAYEFTLFKYHETAIDQRNSHGLLKDLTEAT